MIPKSTTTRAWCYPPPHLRKPRSLTTHVFARQSPARISSSSDALNNISSIERNTNKDCSVNSSSSSLHPHSHSQPAGTLFGAIALITGSTVGAGMLALPEVTAPAGFLPTATGLILTWSLLAAEALLLAEVNLDLMAKAKGRPEDAGKIVTLREMAEKTLGQPGKVVTLIYMLLSYCLLVAYLAKSSDILDVFAGHTLPPAVSAGVLCASTAALFLVGGPPAADRMNQALTSALLLLFVFILGVGVTQNDVVHGIATSPASWSALSPAVPIIFLSLVYHDLVPLICSYLGGDRKMIRSALILGSLVPLVMFLSWEAVALSLVPSGLVVGVNSVGLNTAANHIQEISLLSSSSSPPPSSAAADFSTVGMTMMNDALVAVSLPLMDDVAGVPLTVDPLQVFIRRSGPGVGLAVQGFSFLAVLTSFTGTVMGLSETLRSEVPSMIRQCGRIFKSDAMAAYGEEKGDDGVLMSTTSSTTTPTQAEQKVVVGGGGGGATKNKEQQKLASSSLSTTTTLPRHSYASDSGRAVALALTLGPPLAFTAENPGAFLAVLSIAGGYGMTALYGVMPPLMAMKMRAAAENCEEEKKVAMTTVTKKKESENEMTNIFLPGGVPALAGVLAAAVGVGMSRVAADAGAYVLASSTCSGGGGAAAAVEVAAAAATAASSSL